MPRSRTFHLATLGCKVNQYESQSLREAWIAQGCVEAADAAGADVVVVNSCAVTAGALADLRQLVARVRRAAPQARIVVTGCAAQAVREEVEAIAGVDAIVPQAEKERLLAGLPLADLRSAAASEKASTRPQKPDSAAEEIEISTGGQGEPIPPGVESEEVASGSSGPASLGPASPPAAAGKVGALATGLDAAAKEKRISVAGQEGPIPPGEESEERGAVGSDTAQPGAMPDTNPENGFPHSPRRTEPGPEREISSPRKAGPAADGGTAEPSPAAARSGHRSYPAFAVSGSPSEGGSHHSPRRTEPGPEREIPSPRKAGPAAGHGAATPPAPAPRPTPSGRRFYPAFAVSGSPRARAQVKVQDGCSHGCTYCIVPLARGQAVSREPAEVLAECRRLLAGGWRELVLSGINLRQYRSDKRNFWGLLRFLEEHLAPEWTGRARLRVSSLDPGQLGAEALDTLAASRLACPQLHLSLQAGSPGVLARMGRGHYGPQDILDFLAGLAQIWPLLGLGADLLTGFPGETAEEFEETRALVAALPLTYAHVFPFSPRPGAPATTLPGQVSPEERKRRAAVLRGMAGAKKTKFLNALAALPGLTMVLEDETEGRGTCEYGAECRLDRVPAGAAARALVRVRVLGVEKNGVRVAPVQALA